MSVQKLDSQTWKCEERNFTFTIEDVENVIAETAKYYPNAEKNYPGADERDAEVYELIRDLKWNDKNMQRLAEEINSDLSKKRYAPPYKKPVAENPSENDIPGYLYRDGVIKGGLAGIAMQIFKEKN